MLQDPGSISLIYKVEIQIFHQSALFLCLSYAYSYFYICVFSDENLTTVTEMNILIYFRKFIKILLFISCNKNIWFAMKLVYTFVIFSFLNELNICEEAYNNSHYIVNQFNYTF